MAGEDFRSITERSCRQLDVARAALAVGCAGVQFVARPDWRSGINIITALFAAYSIVLLIWHSARLPGSHLLRLYSGALFFFLFASFGESRPLLLLSALFVYVMLSAIVAHEWWDPFIVAGASIEYLVVARPPDAAYLWYVILPSGVLGCFLALIKRRVERHCDGQAREVEALRAGIKTAREAERQRIAGDFHDGPLQGIVGLQMRLEVLRRIFERDPSTGLRELRSIQDLLKEQIVEARVFLRGMREVQSDESGLSASVGRIIADFQKDSGIPTSLDGDVRGDGIAPEAVTEILQIVREALHNVRKHSKATRTSVSLKRVVNQLELSVEDNGAGFSFAGSYTLDELEQLRIGPVSIQRRVRGLGGDFVLESRPGQGSRVVIRIPA